MANCEIPTLARTIDGRRSMRSIVATLEALRSARRLSAGSFLVIRTNPLPARIGVGPSIVLVVCRATSSEETCGVALPTSYEFTGRPLGKNASETFEISRLNHARIHEEGTVTLSDGTRLEAVNVVPAALPRELTELQKRIVYWTIRFIGAEDACYRYGPPTQDLTWLDFAALRELDVPKLEAIVQYVADSDPSLKIPTNNRQCAWCLRHAPAPPTSRQLSINSARPRFCLN